MGYKGRVGKFAMNATPSRAPSFLESLDPVTGEVIGRFETTPPANLPRVVEHARRAQREWAQVSLAERAGMVHRLADILRSRRREIAEIVTRETGKPLAEALFSDVLVSVDSMEWHARRAPRILDSERVRHRNPIFWGKKAHIEYAPYGIIAVISPWNYPLAIPMTSMIPALIAGNAVILKPSELSPWCGAVLGELFDQASIPPDLVQVIQGRADLGQALLEALPDKVVFTGSADTGRRIGESCARNLLPSVLELGGKDAMIVLSDADLDAASSAAVWGSFTNCGQACLSVERIYVEPGALARFTELCIEKTKKLRLGSGLDPETDVGPMIRPEQIERVERQLHDALTRGASILTGGRRRPDLGPCFFEPAVVAGVDSSMLLMQEETFGPILAIQAVSDAEEAVRLANDSPYGLGASVWTADRARGEAIARQLRCGAAMVNDVVSCYGIAEAPHGGRGESGWGRLHSRLGVLEMVQAKYIAMDGFPSGAKPWWFPYDGNLLELAEGVFGALFGAGPGGRWRGILDSWGSYRARRRW